MDTHKRTTNINSSIYGMAHSFLHSLHCKIELNHYWFQQTTIKQRGNKTRKIVVGLPSIPDQIQYTISILKLAEISDFYKSGESTVWPYLFLGRIFGQKSMVAYFCPLHASYFSTDYVKSLLLDVKFKMDETKIGKIFHKTTTETQVGNGWIYILEWAFGRIFDLQILYQSADSCV